MCKKKKKLHYNFWIFFIESVTQVTNSLELHHHVKIKQLLRLHEFNCADSKRNVTCRRGNDTIELLQLHCIGIRALHFLWLPWRYVLYILLPERSCIVTGAILRVLLYYISDIVLIAIPSSHTAFGKINISLALS